MGEKGFKGFKPGLVCKNKQYAENTVFEEDAAEICRRGMHYCVNPFDVLDHYNLVNNDGSFNDFAEVEALDRSFTNDGKKYCTKKLKIGAKLSFSGFIKACVDFTIEKTSFGKLNDGSSGNYAQIGSSGYSAQIGSSGYSAKIGSSGDYAQIGSSGNSAQIGSSGNSAQIGSSGYSAKIGSSGDYAKIGSSGNSAQIGSTGMCAVVMCAGYNSMAKAKKGSFITLAEWKKDDENDRWIPINVVTEKVDGERIKEDTFYKLIDGKFVEVGDDDFG